MFHLLVATLFSSNRLTKRRLFAACFSAIGYLLLPQPYIYMQYLASSELYNNSWETRPLLIIDNVGFARNVEQDKCETLWWDTVIRHSWRKLFLNTRVGVSHTTCSSVWRSLGTLLWVRHSCKTSWRQRLSNILVRHLRGRGLSGQSNFWHSCYATCVWQFGEDSCDSLGTLFQTLAYKSCQYFSTHSCIAPLSYACKSFLRDSAAIYTLSVAPKSRSRS